MSMMDERISPMLASQGGTPFDDPGWIYEIKWDGSRTIAFLSGDVRLQDRRLNNITSHFPELMYINRCLKVKEAVLDGELVVMRDNKPHFRSIMARKNREDTFKIKLLSKSMPAMFITWDILYADGRSLIDLPLMERKEILTSAVQPGGGLAISDFIPGQGKMLFEETGKRGLEGVMAKKADSKYYVGKRSSLWLKLKHLIAIDAVIMGYRVDKTALVVGLYDEGDKLITIGSVESGMSHEELAAFMQAAGDIKQEKKDNIQWLEPALVCRVRFMEWSENMKMRAPVFEGFKYDVRPGQCRFQ